MSINKITTDDLRRMNDREGLILQGCGGDLQEWVEGINQMLTEEGILLEGTVFNNCSTFEHENLTCLVFFFDDTKLDGGKLAMWRLKTHGEFGGTWLSDYVPNHLGGFAKEEPEQEVQQKPDCPLIGQNGNIFNLAGIASLTLKEHGMEEQAEEMKGRIYSSGSYSEALNIIGEYVNITSEDDMEEGMDREESIQP
jgi:hypothetical protein